MESRLIGLFLLLVAIVATTGCQAVLKPSNRARHAAYLQRRKLFRGNEDVSLRNTYFVFSGDLGMPRPYFDRKSQKMVFPGTKKLLVARGWPLVSKKMDIC
jgi:hypothetical protein